MTLISFILLVGIVLGAAGGYAYGEERRGKLKMEYDSKEAELFAEIRRQRRLIADNIGKDV